MAELLVSASTGAMGSLLEKLGTMLSDEYKMLKGVRGDIEFLKKELEAMRAFLLMMADVEEPDPQDKLRANAVRELSYEIEDKIDEFMILVEREPSSKSDGIWKLLKNKIADIKTRYKIAKDVKDITSQVTEESERCKRYKMDKSSRPTNEKVDPRVCAFYKDVSELVGIDGPRDELVKCLEGKSALRPKVVSIVGSGGLGKTTLARQVYDKLEANYNCRAFVSISRSPDMKNILSSILSEISDGKEHARESIQQIIDQIRKFLKDKRYFIIIDDIWDMRTWQYLNCALVGGCGSVIMTTTRIHDVAKSCGSSHGDLVYNIQRLSVADSKKLFFKRIFGCEEKCPPYLKEASEDILKKCGGLPLAINAISSLLATKKTKDEWDRVRRSIVSAQGEHSDIDDMNYILSLSYFHLPLYLRSCLLYLTMFPEDYEIERQRLVHRWISEGFIHGKDEEDLVAFGDAYFHQLVNRSLIQPVEIGYDGMARCCRVHDTILDFLIYRSAEENFCTLLSNNSKPDCRVRRLSLMGNEDQESVEQLDLSHARSLGAFCDAKQLPSLVKSKTLRVLDVQGCDGIGNHVRDIGRLFQLRYLNISRTNITELPESVTRLKRLARLFVPSRSKFPDGIGNMKNLQELEDINPFVQSVKFLEELGKLTNLRKLGISCDTPESDEASDKEKFEKEEKLVSSLCKLDTCKLRILNISFHDATVIGRPFFPALNTKWLPSLVNLEKLYVSGNQEIEQQDVEMVGSIPTLLLFKAWTDCVGPIIISGGFQQLRNLEFFGSTELKFEAGAMPNLKELLLYIDLKKLKSAGAGFDFGIQHLSSLASLHVDIDCEGVRAVDVEGAEGAFKSMADAHPNRPTLEMTKRYTVDMLQDDE